jgi:hypothetical protein
MSESVITGEKAWETVCAFVQNDGRFKTATGIVYESRVSGNRIFYKGGKANGGREEDINRDDFVVAFNALPVNTEINVTTIKDVVSAYIYKKRTPFLGLLQSAGIVSNAI